MPTDAEQGLTAGEVAEQVRAGRTNATSLTTSRTIGEIIRANVLTRFNALLGTLAVVVLLTGRVGDALFGVVLVVNSLIGIVQEVHAKRKLDRLALLNAPTVRVVRDGAAVEVRVAEVVLGDLIELRAGDQVPADGPVVTSAGLEVDESTLTGESDSIHKSVGDAVRSGTIVVAGDGRLVAEAVGDDSYANRLAAEAKRYQRTSSDLEQGIDTLLRYATWVIVLVAPLLLWSQWRARETDAWQGWVTASVAAMVGMVPEGLVLLTSVAFLLGALQLSRRQVLVQELPAVEGLARVDLVCLDKTGTLTVGDIVYEDTQRVDPDGTEPSDGPEQVLGALADVASPNGTFRAIAAALASPGWSRTGEVPFSSARKWSAATFADHGSWFFGAPDVLLAAGDPLLARVGELTATGRRVLLLQCTDSGLDGEHLPADRRSVALCVLTEDIRPDAAETLSYFADQGVGIKVISGDNPATVAAVAREVGLDVGEPVDARSLGEEVDDVRPAADQAVVFGRVTPHQKRSLVQALQASGRTVAMTGDGVNDALALKDADMGVAMGNAAPATKAVAQIVLLDGKFSRLPRVLAEGRRVIGNVERVANLFVTKNAYSLVLVLLTAVARLPYPFLPRHLTLISGVTIGIPAFVLALGPNTQRYRPGFLHRVLRFALPAGAVTAVAIFGAYLLARLAGADPDERRTAATVACLVVALWVLVVLARPFAWWKGVLVAAMAGLAALAFVIPWARDFFELTISGASLGWSLLIGAAGAVAVEVVARFAHTVPHDVRRTPPRAAPAVTHEPARATDPTPSR